MLEAYRAHVSERAELGIPPKALDPAWTADLVELLKAPPAGEEEFLLDLIANRVPPGVDEAAYVKASFLSAIVNGEAASPLIDRAAAVALLGNMHGGYNVETLVKLLDDDELAPAAAQELKGTTLVLTRSTMSQLSQMQATATPKPYCNLGQTPSGSRVTTPFPKALKP